MKNKIDSSLALHLRGSSGALGSVVELNGFVGHIVGEESNDVLKVKFLIKNKDDSSGVVISTIHRKYLKVVHNGKDKPNTKKSHDPKS